MEEQKLKEKVSQETLIKTNLAYILSDVAESFMLDVDASMQKVLGSGAAKYGEKYKFKLVAEDIKRVHKRIKELICPMYDIPETDDACEDSDWFADMFLLIVDRAGTKPKNMDKIRKAIYNMKSELKLYDKWTHKS